MKHTLMLNLYPPKGAGLPNIGKLAQVFFFFFALTASFTMSAELLPPSSDAEAHLPEAGLDETGRETAVMPPPFDCNNPIVGKSVVIDRISSGLAGLLLGGSTLDNLVDGDLNNFTEVAPTASVLGSSLISIKNTEVTYPAGRRVGFVIETNGGLLSASALDGLAIRTSLDDAFQETVDISGGGGLLNVSLLGSGEGKQRIDFITTLPFDEVELLLTSALSVETGNLRVYYAFEEDPACDADCDTDVIPANGFTPGIVSARTGFLGGVCLGCGTFNAGQAIDDNLTNGALIDFGISVAATLALSVNTGAVQPAGTEAGFNITQSGLLGILDLSILGGFTIQTYQAGVFRESVVLNSGLANVGVLPGGDTLSLSIPTTLSFDEVQFRASSGVLGLLNGITVYNLFLRYDDDLDGVPNCIDKCVGDDNIVNSSGLPLACNPECTVDAGLDVSACPATDGGLAQLSAASGGQTWSAVPGNPGSASINAAGEITGLDVMGTYQFVLSDGTCTDTVAVIYQNSAAASGCNDPITGPDVIVDNAGALGGVCVLCGTGDAANVVDGNLRNALVYNDLLSLLGSSALISVKDTANIYPAGSRAGYVIAFPGGLLSAGVLSGIEIRTYLNDNLQEVGSTGLGLVSAAALGADNQQRIGFTTTLPYDEVELVYNNVVSLLGSIEVYYAFTEDAACDFGEDFSIDPSVLCIEPLIADSDYCGMINYEATGFSGVLCVDCVIEPLAALVDSDLTNGTELNVTAAAANNSTVAVQSGKVFPAGYEAGFAVSGSNGLLGLTVLNNLTISTYLNGVPAESFSASSPLLSLSLLSGGAEVGFLGFTTSEDFDEVRLTVGGLVGLDLLGDFEIYYAYVRIDSDGDGVPDCLDKCCSGDDLIDTDGNGIPDGCDGVPVALPDTFEVVTLDPINLDVLANDDFGPDLPDTAAIVLITAPMGGTATVDDMGTPNDPTDDVIVYTPPADQQGQDTLIYQISDLNGSRDTALVIITYDFLNDNPVANDDLATTDEDTPFMGNVLTNDVDPDGPDTLITLVDDVMSGTLTLNEDGTFTYEPDADFAGMDTFSYSYCDGGMPALCDTAMVTITVDAVNDVPEAINDTVSVVEDMVLTGDVLVNDTDVDGPDTLITLVDDVSNGSLVLNGDGSFTYTPDGGYSGTDSFSYSYCDGGVPNLCDTAVVNITVQADEGLLSLKVLLQGALYGQAGAVMRADLSENGHLPLTEPYTAIGNPRFTHVGDGGGEMTNTGVLDANAGTDNAIVDWVFVELRDPLDSTQVVETRAALLQSDGDVVAASDGVSPLTFTGRSGQDYFVAVKHRNHMGVMTAAPVTLLAVGVSVDFITALSEDVYNFAPQYEGFERATINSVNALWAGSAIIDGKVKFQGPGTDVGGILLNTLMHPDNNDNAFNFNGGFGYFLGDVNLDGKVKYQGLNNDPFFVFLNIISYQLNTGDAYNFDFLLEQLPGN